MARTYNDIYYNDDENSTAEILDDMKKLAESVDQQIGSIKSFNNDTSQFIEQVTPLMSNLSEQVIDMHQLADTMFTELEQVKEENKQLREDLNGLPKGQASGESIDLNDSAEMRCELKISGNSVQDGEPTPDKPVEVESCGDNINIFDKDNANIKNWYIDTNNKKIASSNSENRILIQEIKPNTTYTISKKLSTFIVATCTNMPTLNSSTTQAQRNDNATKIAIASGSSDKYLVVQFKTQADTLTEQEILNSIKIVEGTETGEYSPYGQGCINEVICNKNLWNINYSGTKQAITYNLSKNKITLNGTSNGLGDVFNTKNHSTFFLKAGTYTINAKVISGSFTAGTNDMALYFKKKSDDKNFVSLYKGINYTAKGTITFTEDDEVYVYSFVNGSNVIFNNLVIEIQMEEGSTETDCVEHQEQSYTIPTQQPMRAIGNVRDKFILKENGKWYERHYIFRKIFDGTETFTKETRNEVTNFYMFLEGFGSQKGYCNILPVVNSDSYIANILFIWSKLNGFSMMFDTSRFGTLSDYKSYLKSLYDAGTPAYLDYVLKEPLDIECTEEQSTILFDIEQNAKTYDKVTHMYSTDNVSPVIDVTYKKDIETLFANTLVEGV